MSHPVIGLWAIEIKYADRPRVDRGTLLFHPDGSLSMVVTEHSSHAVWQATGERTATINGTRPVGPNEGFVGWYTLKAGASVSDDGLAINISASQSRPRPDGSLMEQRADITGSRVVVQPA